MIYDTHRSVLQLAYEASIREVDYCRRSREKADEEVKAETVYLEGLEALSRAGIKD